MGSWNHRVIRSIDKESGEHFYDIHEVHYDGDGSIRSWTEHPVSPGAEDIESVKWVLGKMIECLDKPILQESVVEGSDVLVEI